jgi:hypothetical protein
MSNPENKGPAVSSNEDQMDDARFLPGEILVGAEQVTMNDIDLRDIGELESDDEPNNAHGEEIRVSQGQLHRLTSGMIESVSHACMRAEAWHLAWTGAVVCALTLASAAWYFGAIVGVHRERLSVVC